MTGKMDQKGGERTASTNTPRAPQTTFDGVFKSPLQTAFDRLYVSQGMLSNLSSQNPLDRMQAMNEILDRSISGSEKGSFDPIVAPMIDILEHGTIPNLRERAALVLGVISNPSALEPLARVIREHSASPLGYAADFAHKLIEKTMDADELVEYLDHASGFHPLKKEMARIAKRELIHMGGGAVTRSLVGCLEKGALRKTAEGILIEIGPEAAERLMDFVKDPDIVDGFLDGYLIDLASRIRQ
jgi:hypothetical protein